MLPYLHFHLHSYSRILIRIMRLHLFVILSFHRNDEARKQGKPAKHRLQFRSKKQQQTITIRAQNCKENLRFYPRILHTKAMTSEPAPGRTGSRGRSGGSNSSGGDPSGDGPRPGTPRPPRAPPSQVNRLDHLFHVYVTYYFRFTIPSLQQPSSSPSSSLTSSQHVAFSQSRQPVKKRRKKGKKRKGMKKKGKKKKAVPQPQRPTAASPQPVAVAPSVQQQPPSQQPFPRGPHPRKKSQSHPPLHPEHQRKKCNWPNKEGLVACDSKLTWDRQLRQWTFHWVYEKQPLSESQPEEVRACSLDPGVRTFLTW